MEKGAFGKRGRRAQRAPAHRQIRDDILRPSLRSNDDGADIRGEAFELSFIGNGRDVVMADCKPSVPICAQLASKRIDREKIEETFDRPGLAYPANEISVALWALWLHQTSS
jgi:hypothetical protein